MASDDQAAGRFLHNMLGGSPPEPGPPYVHTWQPSIPLPFYSLLHVICGCGKRFWGRQDRAERRYQRHYGQAHQHPYTIVHDFADPD